MKLLKNTLFTVFFTLVASAIYAGKAYAKVDITLEDNKEEKTISVIVNSNDTYLPAMNLNIKFSEDVTIDSSVNTEEYCKFSSTNNVLTDKVNILCFNNAETIVNGKVAVISYSTTSDNYSFYVDRKSLDLAGLPVGEIKDINKLDESTQTTDTTEAVPTKSQANEDTTPKSRVINFLTKNRLYVLAGSITILAIVIAIIGFAPTKKEENR